MFAEGNLGKRHFVMGDIHGEFEKLMTVMSLIKDKAGFDPTKDIFVQCGDKNDRGSRTYEVFEYFAQLTMTHPDNVWCLLGNHEDMWLNAIKGYDESLFYYNGGKKTAKSYERATGRYGKMHMRHNVMLVGHFDFLLKHPIFYETHEYFFCHAPISRHRHQILMPIRMDRAAMLWGYEGHNTEDWVEPNFENKICVHGHIHGLHQKTVQGVKQLINPGVRQYGNTYLIDTGSGCGVDGYLTCLELPARVLYNSKGEVIKL